MPTCKNCGTRLTKFDKDICPVCGTKHPLEGVSSETIEITSEFSKNDLRKENVHIKRKKTFKILFSLFGFLGMPFFYIKENIKGTFLLISELLVMGGIFTGLYVGLHIDLVISLGTMFGIIFIINTILALVIFNKKRYIKDKDGNLLL